MSDRGKGFIQLFAVIVFIIAAFAISALLQSTKEGVQRTETGERILAVETQQVVPGPYRIEFQTTGTVEARAQIGIVPEVSGRITEISDQIFEGGSFEEGETLFQIDPHDFRLEVRRLEADVARAKTALDIEEAESAAALLEWDQLNSGEEAPALVARKPQMAEARANLNAAKAQLENARLDLKRTSFAFPFNGRVLSASLEKGQYVQVGQNYGEAFNLDTLEVQASLEDQELKWLLASEDPVIEISTTYLGEKKTYEGVLKQSASSFDADTRFAQVRFGFKEDVIDLLPGLFVDIDVRGPELENISLLPAEALQNQTQVWTVENSQTLQLLEPEIVYAGEDKVAVRGIDTIVDVVTSRLNGARAGMQVNVRGTE